jgi:lipoate-protein ligase B
MVKATHSNLIPCGLMDYSEAWSLQHELARARGAGEIDDTLLLLEHPHTYTLGRSAKREHLLLSEAECAARGISVLEVDRGGDITYHGPGQLVAYPIRYLGEADASGRLVRADYIGYLRQIEEVLIGTLRVFGITGQREDGLTGVWVETAKGPAKVAAIGVKITARGVSLHGTALNVTTDLSYFGGIVPCGISDKPVTSLRALLGADAPDMIAVSEAFCAAYEAVFACALREITLDALQVGESVG